MFTKSFYVSIIIIFLVMIRDTSYDRLHVTTCNNIFGCFILHLIIYIFLMMNHIFCMLITISIKLYYAKWYMYSQGQIYYEANEASASGPHHLGGPHQNINAVS